MTFFFHKYLLQISEQLSSREVAKLCYLCRDLVPKSQAKDINEGYQFFDILEEKKMLAPGNVTFLLECFHTIGRFELVHKLQTDREESE